MASSASVGISFTRPASDSAPTSTRSHLVPPAEGATPWVDKGKGLVVETFVRNLDYTFKKMTRVVPRGDLEDLLKMNSGDLYQRMVLDLAEVISFMIT